MTRCIVHRTALAVLLLLTLCQSGHAAVAIGNLDRPVSIAGSWQFSTGDNIEWAQPGLDDSNWQAVGLPSTEPETQIDFSGMAWYRLTLQLDLDAESVQQQLGSLAVSIGGIRSAYELYAGGQKLGGVGALPPEPQVVFDRFQTYPITHSAIDEAGRLVLALRVWRAPGGAENNPYQGPFLVGNVGDLRSSAVFQALVPNIILAALYLAIGLYHLLIAHRNPSMREFFWFGWLAMALATYSFETSQLKFTLDIPYLLHKKIEYFALYMLPFLFVETLTRVTGAKTPRALCAFQYVFLVYAVAVVAVPNFDIHYLTLGSFQVLAAVCLLGMVLWMGWLGWQGNRRARAIFIINILFFIAVFNYITSDNSVLGTTYLLHFMFALVVLFMAVLMANNYTATLAKLEQSVEERTADLQQTNRELESAVAVRSQFLANMSHELRTPMNAIIGLTHLGLKTDLTEQQRGYLETVEQSAQALGGIIEGIFDFSKLEAGELQCVEKPFSLERVFTNLAAVYRPQAETKGLAIAFGLDPAIPPALLGDASRLGQILGHFTSNAIKFTDRGEVRCTAQLREQSDNGVVLEFAVSDTGPGLDPEQREHLFESFSQADNTNTRAHGGTGLGLAISQALARLMGGSIEVESEQGSGSTFRLILPLAVADEEPEAEDAVAEEELDLRPIYGARVLLVDDSEINLQVAGELLSQARLHVELARNGQEAVNAVQQMDFDCILMDIQMPVMDGNTATETIRAMAGHEALPILAMTANVLPEDRARATQAGVNDHIPKPINPQELYSKLLRWIPPGERESFEPDPQPVEAATELPPQLPGIAISDGMKRVGGNSKLYVKLLLDVRANYESAAQSIEKLYQEGDSEGASQLAHKLRGIANNLGATDAGQAAEQLELRLKAGEAVDSAMFTALGSSMNTLMDSINELEQLSQGSTAAGEISTADLNKLLDRLGQEISDNNPASEETIEQLLQGTDASAEIYPALAAIRDTIDIFDFAGASEHLATARAAIKTA